MSPETVRDQGAPANSYLEGLRRENRGMRILVREVQLPLARPDTRRAGASQPSLVVGHFHLADPGGGSLSRLLVHLTGQTFKSADDFLKRLGQLDPKVGRPWRILSGESLRPVGVAEADWAYESADVPVGPIARPRVVRPSSISASPITEPQRETVASDTPSPWVSALLETEAFQERLQSLGRAAPSRDDVATMLSALDRAAGKLTAAALAGEMRKSPLRQRGLLAAAQRLLNLDGYQSLRVDVDSDTVVLDRNLLMTQFDISTGDSVNTSEPSDE